jgi:4-hydroxy-3-methylbut-2-enyl diphosphate reductase
VRRLLLASPRSACAGVDRAIAIVERALDRFRAPVYVRKQIVHNDQVVARLEARGAVFVDEVDEVPRGATVIYSAHGVSPAVREAARERGLRAIDATCPLVAKVHDEARRLTAQGRTVAYIGHAGHEESEGTIGEAPDKMQLIESPDDARTMPAANGQQIAYLTQTTLAMDETSEVVDALRARFPDLAGPRGKDICYATTNRQNAVRRIADEADLVLVVGSGRSSNAKRLVEVCERTGTRAKLIATAGELDPDWLRNVDTVGLTSAASTPEELVQEVIDTVTELSEVTIEEVEVAKEDVSFVVPPELR